MRIQSHIFFSVFLATMVPLVALALAASYYSEYNYQREIKREIITYLNNITVEITREIQDSRNLVLGISRAAAIKSFMPILRSVAKNENHPGIRLARRKINRYLEGFQTIIPGDFVVRILDINGDTLVKVSHDKTSQPQYENLQGINYVEHQEPSPKFIKALESLPRGEVNFFTLPHHEDAVIQLLDFVVPLYDNHNKWLGSLVVTLSGEQIDRIVHNVTRLYKGTLFIAENNPDDFNRHSLLIYDEKNKLDLAQNRAVFHPLKSSLASTLFDESIQNVEGLINHDNSLIYYAEFFPYPNRLLGWVIALNVEEKVLFAPFKNNRVAIWLFAAAAFLFTLIMISFSVRKISNPICSLAAQLKNFANGKYDPDQSFHQPITEIQALSSSFNYMADTLVRTQKERDKAQGMALQNDKLASIGQMAAGIGHEINNPLNNILSYSTLISREIAKNSADIDTKNLASLQQDIDSLRSETLRASAIIKGILNFSRQMPPQLQTFLVSDWLKNSILLVQQTAKTHHIEIDLNYDGDDVFEGDQSQLQQVIINLLINSIHASADGDVINIDVQCGNEELKVIIIDNGCGINEEDLNNIYDPFFSTKEEGEGSGLGLSISLGIIESHHGTLSIRNNTADTKGITATLVLPMTHN